MHSLSLLQKQNHTLIFEVRHQWMKELGWEGNSNYWSASLCTGVWSVWFYKGTNLEHEDRAPKAWGSRHRREGCPHPTENFWILYIKIVHLGGFWVVKFEILILQIGSILYAEVKKQCLSV